MRLLVAILISLVGAQATAQPLTCDDLRVVVRALPVDAAALSAQISSQTLSTDSCVFDGGLTCQSPTTDTWRAKSVQMAQESAVYVDLETSRVSIKRVERVEKRWVFNGVVADRLVASAVTLADGCTWVGLSTQGVDADFVDPHVARGVGVNGLPTWVDAPGEGGPGFVPPTLRFGEFVDGSASGFVLANLGLGVDLAPSHFYGGHILAVSDDIDVLEVGATYGDDAVRLHAIGTASLTDVFSADLRLGPTDLLGNRELETRSFLTREQRSRVGVSLRSPLHAGNLALMTRTGVTPQTRQAVLRFGGRTRVGWLTLEADLLHRSAWQDDGLADGQRSVHGSVVGVRLLKTVGTAGAYVEPRLDAGMTFGVVPTDDGYLGSATATVVPQLVMGGALVGRFDELRHGLALTARGGAEVYGFTQREPLPPRSIPFVFGREPALWFLEAVHTQSLQTESIAVTWPTRLRVDALGEWGSTGLDARWRNLGITTKWGCGLDCQDVEHLSAIHVDASFVELGVGVGRGELRKFQDRTAAGVLTDVVLRSETALELSAVASVTLMFGDWSVWSAGTFSDAVSANGGVAWDSHLGWHVAAELGYDSPSDRRLATVGVRYSRD